MIESTKHSNSHNLQQHEKESCIAPHYSELLSSKVLCIQVLQEDIEYVIHYHPESGITSLLLLMSCFNDRTWKTQLGTYLEALSLLSGSQSVAKYYAY